jgi:hypothetical protein
MGLGVGDVVVGRRRGVAAEGVVVGRHRRGHTEGGVGVVVLGAEAAAGEFAKCVGGFNGLLATAHDRHVVGVDRTRVLDGLGRPVEGVVPCRPNEFAVLPDERASQPLALRVSRLVDPALTGQPAVDRMGRIASNRIEAVAGVDGLSDVPTADRTPHTGGRDRIAHRTTTHKRS